MTINDPDQLADVVPGASFRAHALSRAPFRVTVQSFALGDLSLQVGHSSAFAGLAVVAPGCAILQIPFDNIDTLILNGTPLEQPGFGVYGSGAELQRANPQANRHLSLTLPEALVEALLEPPPAARLFRPDTARLIRAPSRRLGHVVAIARQADRIARSDPQRFAHEHVRLSLRAALLDAARGLVRGAVAGPSRRGPGSRARTRLVREADAFIRAHGDEALYPEQLCQALGVSNAALHDAFVAHLATSPCHLLERRRLDLVRANITAPGSPPASVKALALARGFWDFEQFQVDYARSFGESVTETLHRTGGNVTAFPGRRAGG